MSLPETIMQFGTGRFLRAFADLFIHQANQAGQKIGKVVLIQSTAGARAEGLTKNQGRYHVLVQGFEKGQVIERLEECESISRALVAQTQWHEILAVAQSPDLKVILSNTTEAGYELSPDDLPSDSPPKSFPAKLLATLCARFEAGGSPIAIVPCELRENNAKILRTIVVTLAREWKLDGALVDFVANKCTWHNTLVDRIVTGTPAGHPLLQTDPMLIACEPYALFAIEEIPGSPRWIEHPSVIWTEDVLPYFLRKVRLLNGAHSALLIKAWPKGFKIVRDAVNDPILGPWLATFLETEVVPVLGARVNQPLDFAHEVLDRFRNPFLDHKLADIAQHHEQKVQVRLVPTQAEYMAQLGSPPLLLGELLADGGRLIDPV